MGLLWVRTLNIMFGIIASEIRRESHHYQPPTNWLEILLFTRGFCILLWCTVITASMFLRILPANADLFSSTSDLHVWICLWLTQWTHMHMTKCSFYRTFSKNSASLIFGIPNSWRGSPQMLSTTYSALSHSVQKRYKPVTERCRWSRCCSKLQVSKAHTLFAEASCCQM